MATSAAEHIDVEPVSAEAVRSLMEPHQPPCLSLFMPTHRNVPDNRVDRSAYRHLVEALELAALGVEAARRDRATARPVSAPRR